MSPEDMLRYCQPPNVDLSCPAHAPPLGQLALDPKAYTMLPISIAISVVCSILVLAAMSIRIFTRIHLMHTFALEDSLMILATASFFGFLCCIFASAPFGIGKHMWDFTIAQLLAILQRVYAGQIINCIHIYSAKLAIVVQIKRIFTVNFIKRDPMYCATWVVIVLLSTLYTIVFFVCLFPCIPVRRAWEPAIKGWCMDKSVPGVLGANVNLITDLVMISLPIIGVARLQMPRGRKIAVAAVFTTGAL
ncbi:hypothetical protein J1614_003538 [Plenodomus biglobosus]|nr:hypothetical protein J1614_003538 [Plenodomus biglobosus]